MEAEHADLLDRRLMALYGIVPSKPTKMDQAASESLAVIAARKTAYLASNAPRNAPTRDGSNTPINQNSRTLPDISSAESVEEHGTGTGVIGTTATNSSGTID